jgi:hypothetical protein
MEQRVARLAPIVDGLSDRQHPMGNSIYAVRAGETFIYIGKTIKGVWQRIRAHKQVQDPLWILVQKHWPAAADWRVEVCDFRDEPGTYKLEGELIRIYQPVINITYKTERRPTADDLWEVQHNAFGPACQMVLTAGWPSFRDIPLETLPVRSHTMLERSACLATALPADLVGLEQYDRLSVAEQDLLQFWIANAVAPAKQIHNRNNSKGLALRFNEFGLPVSREAFRGAMLLAGYTAVWNGPTARECDYYLRQAMRPGQSDSKWHHRTELDYVAAFAYSWYWTTDALLHYDTLLEKLGESTAVVRKCLGLLLVIQQGQRVDRQEVRRWHV